jgi:hypothetical protein
MSVINGVTVADDNEFAPQPKIVRAAEMTNGLGQTLGDFVRTKYVLPFKWDELPQDVLNDLIIATDPNNYLDFPVSHPTISGTYTGTYKVTSPLQGKKLKYDAPTNTYVWTDVTLELEEV